ncbi:MAG: GerAB/ArcD/ProY family transporter [Clostridiales bacterium]|nr:GerAB/ArcD/ProY family transporter [Clostridiales bacterium]
MNKELSLRQIAYMFVFISISPIIRQLPRALASEAGRSAYISPFWSAIAMILITAIVLGLLKAFPGFNLYEIMLQLAGTFFTKIIILGYLLWIMLSLVAKINIYSHTLQFTLMPQTRSNFFLITLIVLVSYALLRGIKTVFRFSEFTLGTILVLFIILFLCALPKVRPDYLLPVSTIHLMDTVRASKSILAVGGNIIIVLFLADKLGISITTKQKRRVWIGVLIFILLNFFITLFTIGITGASLTANLPFPFYITVKSISFFNILERFEVIVTLICTLSDFIAICIFTILTIRCLEWLFQLKEKSFLYAPLITIIYYLTFYVSKTQFEFEFLYQNVILYINLIFQYAIPILLGLLCLIKGKKIKKQY